MASVQCPIKPSKTKASLLVAFLGAWTEDHSQRLAQALQDRSSDAEITGWSPSETDLQAIAVQSEHPDSQANIYGLATAAFRAGWPGYFVADRLTKRQLNGENHNGESSVTSVVAVAVRTPDKEDEVKVVARRIPVDDVEGENAGLLDRLNTLDLVREEELRKLGVEDGLILHDPDRAFFEPDVLRNSSAGSVWPYDGTKSTPTCGEKFDIFLLFKTSPEKLQELQSAFQNAVDRQATKKRDSSGKGKKPAATNLVAWDHVNTPSRRDIVRIYESYTNRKTREEAVHFLLREIETDELEEEPKTETPFVSIYSNRSLGPLVAVQNTLFAVLQESAHSTPPSRRVSEVDKQARDYKKDGFELLLPFENPFYPISKPWNPVSRRMNGIPLFYLTNSFTREQHDALQSEIQTATDVDVSVDVWPKVCCFVPWPHEKDGAEASMWEILWEMNSYKDTVDRCGYPYFFIDRQSAEDGTIIVLKPSWYFRFDEEGKAEANQILMDVEEPNLRGFLYGRIQGREAHTVWANLSIANMGFEDFFEGREDEIVKVPREGWPGHGVLLDDVDLDQGRETPGWLEDDVF